MKLCLNFSSFHSVYPIKSLRVCVKVNASFPNLVATDLTGQQINLYILTYLSNVPHVIYCTV